MVSPLKSDLIHHEQKYTQPLQWFLMWTLKKKPKIPKQWVLQSGSDWCSFRFDNDTQSSSSSIYSLILDAEGLRKQSKKPPPNTHGQAAVFGPHEPHSWETVIHSTDVISAQFSHLIKSLRLWFQPRDCTFKFTIFLFKLLHPVQRKPASLRLNKATGRNWNAEKQAPRKTHSCSIK